MTLQAHDRPELQQDPDGGQDLVGSMVASLRPRLGELPEQRLSTMVRTALDDLGEVRVTTFLPILVERRVREELRLHPPV